MPATRGRAIKRKRRGRRHTCPICDLPDARWLTAKEVAAVMLVEVRTIYRLLADGREPGHKLGGTWLLDHDALDRRFRKEAQAWER